MTWPMAFAVVGVAAGFAAMAWAWAWLLVRMEGDR
jgi:hypothetical protein